MVASRSSVHDTKFIGGGLDTWAGSAFVQARLALLGKTVFLQRYPGSRRPSSKRSSP